MTKVRHIKNKLKVIIPYRRLPILLGSTGMSFLMQVQPVAAEENGFNFALPPTSGTTLGAQKSEFDNSLLSLLTFMQFFINGLIGFALMIAVLGFLKTAFMLAKGGAKQRPEAMHNLMILTGTTAALGAFPLVLTFIILLLNE